METLVHLWLTHPIGMLEFLAAFNTAAFALCVVLAIVLVWRSRRNKLRDRRVN
jgi:hypothetical protein